ncbi:MAG: helix-turn-helix transcriptional regulator [Lachnospiraceae bacterium]|nr:helix-turn-helix transcriptional regulator [Lachnospiraceae bacterium]
MKRLYKLRKEKHMTQQQLADILNVSQQSIHKYENGICSPSIEGLCDMAEFFDTSIDYLIGATDIPYRYDQIPDGELRFSEKRLLTFYRSLSPIVQSLIQQVITEQEQKE